MDSLLLYWFKANTVLALFAAAYYGLLRHLTFFALNRAYLLFAIGFAAAYPLLPMPALLPAVAGPELPAAAATTGASQLVAAGATPVAFPWLLVARAVYLTGAAALLLRLLGQLLSLALVQQRSRPARVLGQAVRVVPGVGSAFSFGATVYCPESVLADAQALPATLRHEQAHVRQGHTFDVLLLQVAVAVAWLNPAAWLLRRAALDNLEYLADRAALQGHPLTRRDYQYLLLRQQTGTVPAPALAFHFSLLTLKNRILMLNQPLSSSRQLGRYVLAAPLVVLLALGYAGARAQTAPKPAPAAQANWHVPAGTQVYIDGTASTNAAAEALALDPQRIANMDVVNGIQGRIFTHGQNSVIALTTKDNEQAAAVQDLNQQLAQAAALVPSISPSELPKPAQAYISQKFPDCRVAETNKILPAAHQRAAYQATIAKGRRPQGYLLFDEAGNFLEKI